MGPKLSDHLSRFLELVIEDTFNQSHSKLLRNEFQHRLAIATINPQDNLIASVGQQTPLEEVVRDLISIASDPQAVEPEIFTLLQSKLLRNKQNLLKVLTLLAQSDPPTSRLSESYTSNSISKESPNLLPAPSERTHRRSVPGAMTVDRSTHLSPPDAGRRPHHSILTSDRSELHEVSQQSFYSDEPPPLNITGAAGEGEDSWTSDSPTNGMPPMSNTSSSRQPIKLDKTIGRKFTDQQQHSVVESSLYNHSGHQDSKVSRQKPSAQSRNLQAPPSVHLPSNTSYMNSLLDQPLTKTMALWQTLSEELPRPTGNTVPGADQPDDDLIDGQLSPDPQPQSSLLIQHDSDKSLSATSPEQTTPPYEYTSADRRFLGDCIVDPSDQNIPDRDRDKRPARLGSSESDSSSSDFRQKSKLEESKHRSSRPSPKKLDPGIKVVTGTENQQQTTPPAQQSKNASLNSRRVTGPGTGLESSMMKRMGATSNSSRTIPEFDQMKKYVEVKPRAEPNVDASSDASFKNKLTLNINVINDSANIALATLSSNQSTAPDDRRTNEDSTHAPEDDHGPKMQQKTLRLSERLRNIGSKQDSNIPSRSRRDSETEIQRRIIDYNGPEPKGGDVNKPRPTGPDEPRPTRPAEPWPNRPGGDRPTGPSEESRPAGPGESRPTGPGETRPPEPSESRPTRPGESRPTRPGESRPMRSGEDQLNGPGNSRPTRPGESRPSEPNESRPTRPGENWPTGPSDSRPSRPGDSRPTRPGESQPTEPSEPWSTKPRELQPTGPAPRAFRDQPQNKRPNGLADQMENPEELRGGPRPGGQRNQGPRRSVEPDKEVMNDFDYPREADVRSLDSRHSLRNIDDRPRFHGDGGQFHRPDNDEMQVMRQKHPDHYPGASSRNINDNASDGLAYEFSAHERHSNPRYFHDGFDPETQSHFNIYSRIDPKPKSRSSIGESIKRYSSDFTGADPKPRLDSHDHGNRYFSNGDGASLISDSSYPQGGMRQQRSSLGRISQEDAEQALILRSPEGESGAIAVLRDVLYALQGVEGQHLVYDSKTQTFLVADADLPMNRTTRLITCQMALPGTHFRLLKSQLGPVDSSTTKKMPRQVLIKCRSGRVQDINCISETREENENSRMRPISNLFTQIFEIGSVETPSAVRQLFVENVESELARYLVSLGHLEGELMRFEQDLQLHEVTSNLPAAKIAFSNTLLRRLITALKPGLRLVHTLHLMVAGVGTSVGSDLLSRLWRFLFTGDPNCDQVARRIFEAASTPFYKFLRNWVAHGSTSDDLYNEFFVIDGERELMNNKNATMTSSSTNYYDWYKAFKIQPHLAPCFISSTLMDSIIDVGLMAALINKTKSAQNNESNDHAFRTPELPIPDTGRQWNIDQLFDHGSNNWQQNAQQPNTQDELRIDSYDKDAQLHDQKRVRNDWQLCHFVRVHRYEHLRALRHILLVEHGMMEHLKIIRACLLFGAGDFGHNLMELTTELLLNHGSPSDITAGELQSCLAQSLRSSIVPRLCDNDKLERLQCIKMPTAIQFGTSLWDFFSMEYDLLDSPVSVVLTPAIIADLRKVSAYLWKIKRSCDRQHASWFSGQRNAFLLRFPEVNDTVLDALHVRAEVLASLEKIQFRVFYEVLDGLWTDLVLRVTSEGWWESIDELRSIFESFVAQFKVKGFMAAGNQNCGTDLTSGATPPDFVGIPPDPSNVVNDLLDLSNVACTHLDALFMSAYQLVLHKLRNNDEESMSLDEIDQQIEDDRSRFREENAPKMESWRDDWDQCQKQWSKIVNAYQL